MPSNCFSHAQWSYSPVMGLVLLTVLIARNRVGLPIRRGGWYGAAMADRVRIVGNYLSPYVRKVLVCLNVKGVPYEIDPIIPFMGDERFSALSPLRRIPVLIDAHVTLSDSSVICQYLEDRWPEPALYPRDVADRARARWLE